jgi:hypothetical protein
VKNVICPVQAHLWQRCCLNCKQVFIMNIKFIYHI